MKFAHLLCTAAAVYSTNALAQEAAAQDPQDGEIIVTALRTESTASKTPIALSAVTGEQLRTAGVTNPTALGDQVPNLAITRGNGLQITIRGVTSQDGSEKGDPSAAFMLDGIYIARPQVQEVSFFDVARVEVLRGPQGTLYGRNTTAGVVNVIANKPVDRFEAGANFGYGNFNAVNADAFVNVPVSETFALRASGAYERRDSYLIPMPGELYKFNAFKDNISSRLQALWNITPDVSLLVKGDYSAMKGVPLQSVRRVVLFDRTDPRNPVSLPRTSEQSRTLGYLTQQQGSMDNETYGISGELNWDFSGVRMTYLGSYREFARDEKLTQLQAAPVPSFFTGKYRQNSQELRFATTGTGPLKLQAGMYYFHERSGIRFFLQNALPGVPYFGFPQDPVLNTTYAAFGQGTYSLTPTLRLTLGARYSHDDKQRYGGTVRQQTLTFNPATDTRDLNAAKAVSSKVTYRAGLEFDANDRTLLYETFSTGYKAGGFNDGCEAGTSYQGQACNQVRPVDVLYYKPETLTSYEVGFKTRFADNAVRLNGSAFIYDYRNLQLNQQVTLNGGPSAQTSNAAKARVNGIELEAQIAPVANHRFELSYTYLDAHYVDYFPLLASTVAADRALSYAGRKLDRSPTNVVTAGYTGTFPVGGGDIQFGIRTRMSSKYVITSFSTPAQYVQPSTTQTDVSLTYNAPGKAWYIQAYGKNLEDSIRFTGTSSRGDMTESDPRTYGVRVGAKF